MDGPSAERIRLLLHPVESSSLFSKPLNDSTVYILVGQHKETLWENRGDTGDQWRSASVLYGFGLPHYVSVDSILAKTFSFSFLYFLKIYLIAVNFWSDGGWLSWSTEAERTRCYRYGIHLQLLSWQSIIAAVLFIYLKIMSIWERGETRPMQKPSLPKYRPVYWSTLVWVIAILMADFVAGAMAKMPISTGSW